MLNWDISSGYLNRREPVGSLLWRLTCQDLSDWKIIHGGECNVRSEWKALSKGVWERTTLSHPHVELIFYG